MWPQFVGQLKQLDLNVPPGMEEYNPEALQQVMRTKEDVKTAVARINAEASKYRTDVGSAARIGAAELGYKGRIGAAALRQQSGEGKLTEYGRDRSVFIDQFTKENDRPPNINELLEFKRSWELTKVRPPNIVQQEKVKQEKAKTKLLENIGNPQSEDKGLLDSLSGLLGGGTKPPATTQTVPQKGAESGGYQGPAYYFNKVGTKVPVRSQAEYDQLIGNK
jgi:hypothetical protein